MTDTSVQNPPKGYHTVTPFIAVPAGRGSAALDFYQQAFGAEIVSRMDGPDGAVLHAEIRIGDSIMMVSDEIPAMNILAPDGEVVHGSFMLYVPDATTTHARAVAAGARLVAAVSDVFSGDRMGIVMCPFGHRWVISTKIEDVAPEEVERRAREWVADGMEH